eukprot:scaffold77006_cov23-Cyclotella_meneghiniana.AAC.2
MGWHFLSAKPISVSKSDPRFLFVGEKYQKSERNMEVNLALATDMTHERAVERHNKTERNKSRNVSKVPLLFGLAQKCRIRLSFTASLVSVYLQQ